MERCSCCLRSIAYCRCGSILDIVPNALATRQSQVLAWAVATFGPVFGEENIRSPQERSLRFLEEALEVVQASGLTRSFVEAMTDRVYGRQAGSLGQEIGSALMCLEALAEASGIDAQDEANHEFARVQTISPEEFAKRHRAKKLDGLAI